MRWTETQQTLLAGLGLRVWQPKPQRPEPAAAPQPASAHTALPLRRPVVAAPAAAPAVPVAAKPLPSTLAVRPAFTAPTPGAGAPANVPIHAPAYAPAPVVSAPVVAPAPALPASEREAAVARMNWPELQHAVAQCQACGLRQGCTQTVFGVGNVQAELMIVGEAPGEQEDLRGEPFVGPAGQLLDNMLRAVRLSRHPVPAGEPAAAQVFIANTLKCRPPLNRNPEPQELALCTPFLHRQIELVRPRLLLASGKYAVQALLGLGPNAAVGLLRGRVHEYRGIPVVVSYHPSYLLRQKPEKRKAWEDLCLLMDTLASLP